MICLRGRYEDNQWHGLKRTKEGGHIPAPWGPCTPTIRGGHTVSFFHELLWRASCDRTKSAVCWTIAPPGICVVPVIILCRVKICQAWLVKIIVLSNDCWQLEECCLLSNRCHTLQLTRYVFYLALAVRRCRITWTDLDLRNGCGDRRFPHTT